MLSHLNCLYYHDVNIYISTNLLFLNNARFLTQHLSSMDQNHLQHRLNHADRIYKALDEISVSSEKQEGFVSKHGPEQSITTRFSGLINLYKISFIMLFCTEGMNRMNPHLTCFLLYMRFFSGNLGMTDIGFVHLGLVLFTSLGFFTVDGFKRFQKL